MLDRAGFDLGPVSDELEQNRNIVIKHFSQQRRQLLFSPFQVLPPDEMLKMFPMMHLSRHKSIANQSDKVLSQNTVDKENTSQVIVLIPSSTRRIEPDKEIKLLFDKIGKEKENIDEAIDSIYGIFSDWNKDRFYPIVSKLLRSLGYNCEHTRAGVNYLRWDAIILDAEDSIPIEIKSPGEEEFISVKAIRQALENKVILLARRTYPTNPSTTSLVVGYNIPNDRSDVIRLIDDIYFTFGISIGVIDFKSLLRLAAVSSLEKKTPDFITLKQLRGFISVSTS